MTHLPGMQTKAGEKILAGGERYQAMKGRLSTSPRPCVIRVVRVSGTVRKAEEEAVRRARADILRARRGLEAGGGLEGWFRVGYEGGGEGDGGEGDRGGGIVDEDESGGEEEVESDGED